MSNTIVFIHGAWLTKRSWENFTPYFEQQGYTCLTPEWPYRDASVEELRAQLERYASALGGGSSDLGLYFPLLSGWREWKSEE